MIHLEHNGVRLMNNKIYLNLEGVSLYKNSSLGTCDMIFSVWILKSRALHNNFYQWSQISYIIVT